MFKGEDLSEMRSFVILDYVNIAVKLIIACYGIYSKKHVDEAINPLFTFTIFYVIFAILQTMSMVNTITGTTFKEVLAHYKYLVATASIDLIVAAFYLVVTLILKVDDWRGMKEE